MEIEELSEDHPIAERKRDMIRGLAGGDAASQFEARYIKLLNQDTSKIEAGEIALGELIVERGEEEPEQVGSGFGAVDGLRHEMEQWREQAGVSQFYESDRNHIL